MYSVYIVYIHTSSQFSVGGENSALCIAGKGKREVLFIDEQKAKFVSVFAKLCRRGKQLS